MKNAVKKMNKRSYLIVIVIFASILSAIFMHFDCYLCGDEIVTYGMANSNSGGWMLSSGRVVTYLQEEVIGESIGGTIDNLVDFGKDIITNRKNASYFRYERPTETGWYSQETMEGWFQVSTENDFSFGRVYLNSMGDDANSFLYYMLVHLVSSLFPAISATKWAAFIVNVVALSVSMVLLYCIGKRYASEKVSLISCFVWGCSFAYINQATYLRAYSVVTVFQLALFLLHLILQDAYKENNIVQIRKCIRGLLILYPIGYVTHYTTGLWAVALGIMTIIFICRKVNDYNRRRLFLCKYISFGMIAIMCGILLDPISVLGLLMKLKSTANKNIYTVIGYEFESLIRNIWGNYWFLGIFVAILLFTVFVYWRKRDCIKNASSIMGLYVLLCGYCLVVVLIMKQGYYRGIYPLLCMAMVLMVSLFVQAIVEKCPLQVKKIWVKCDIFVLLGIILLYASVQIRNVYHNKQQEGRDYIVIENMLEDFDKEKIILIRNHAQSYDYLYLLPEYRDALVITDIENTEDEILEDFVSRIDQSINIIVDANTQEIEAVYGWLTKREESINIEILYEGENKVLFQCNVSDEK